MSRRIWSVIAFVTLVPLALGAAPRVDQRVDNCAPAFSEIQPNRGLPGAYVEQGLASMPDLYPRHELLVQRRSSTLGDVVFSLLYKKDKALDPVTIQGAAVRPSKAWTFRATCSSAEALGGLVTVLERVSALR